MSTSFFDWRRVLLPLLWIGVIVGSAAGQVPRTLAFQALLTDDDGVVLASGDYGVTFRLYDAATEGSALWSEVQSVSVVDGVANATLGRINPLTLSFQAPYWLGITLQQGGSELMPRIPLTSGPYALMAENVPDGSIGPEKIADGAVTTAKIQEEGLDGAAIADGAITPGKLADGAVTAVKLSDDAVGTGAIIDGSITSDDIADGAIETAAIANGAVTPQKVATTGAGSGQALVFNGQNLVWGAPSGSGVISEVAAGDGLTGGGTGGIVTLSIAPDALTTNFIAPDAIGNSELAANAVDTENIVNESVTTQKLDPGAASSGDVLTFDGTNITWIEPSVADGSITADKLAASAVTTNKIDAAAVTTDKIGLAAVTAGKIGVGAVGTAAIDDAAVTANKLGDGAVTTTKLADESVTPAKINSSTASADHVIRYTGTQVEWGPVSIPDESIDTDQLANLAVTSGKIADASVNSDKIASSAVNSIHVGLGQITNSHIGGLLALDKLSTLGADEGDVITFTGGVVSWEPGSVLDQTGNVRIDGDLAVSGSVEKGGGTFKIDHPLDPENRWLYHSFVESDEMMNVYSGNVTLAEDGTAWVELPDWFEALNKDYRYQLTCVGGFAPVYVSEPIASKRFQIAGGHEGLQVSWQVTAVRDDPWARKNKMRVDVEKPAPDRGTLLHPDAYEQ